MDIKMKYEKDEEILCNHQGLLYRAKIVEVDEEIKREDDHDDESLDKDGKYFIHYVKWNPKWDEWVNEDRMFKVTDENLKKKLELDSLARLKKGKKTPSRSSTPTVPGGRKEKGAEGPKSRKPLPKHAVAPELGESLRMLLVDDQELVNKQKKLHRLPIADSDRTVSGIITHFYDTYSNTKPIKSLDQLSVTKRFASSLEAYFNAYLSKYCLYECELKQFQEIVASLGTKKLSDIYGGVHLLRLLVCIELMWDEATIGEEHRKALRDITKEFVKFLSTLDSQTFFQLSSS